MYYLVGWDHENKIYVIWCSPKLNEVEDFMKTQKVGKAMNDWKEVAIMQRIK